MLDTLRDRILDAIALSDGKLTREGQIWALKCLDLTAQIRTCDCGQAFVATRSDRRHCSPKCQQKAWHNAKKEAV